MKKIVLGLLMLVSFGGAYAQQEKPVVIGTSFWSNWYVQAGLDMTLQNPYGKDFSKTFPKGKTFGLNGAVGKRFSPEIGLRFRLNWENGFPLFKNNHLEWVGSGDYDNNMDGGGYLVASIDVQLSPVNIIAGYDSNRKWDIVVFPRAGLTSNLATGSGSPMVGAGFGGTYRIDDRWSIYADMAYQVTTSEFFDGVGSGTGMSVSTGCNGFFDFQVGVQFNLGKRTY